MQPETDRGPVHHINRQTTPANPSPSTHLHPLRQAVALLLVMYDLLPIVPGTVAQALVGAIDARKRGRGFEL